MRKFHGAVWTLLFFGLVMLGGCGSSNNNNYVVTGEGGNANTSTGTVLVNFKLLQRAVPTNITEFRFLSFDSKGAVVYGPKVVAKAANITLDGVSTETAKFRIEYLENGVVRGFYEGPLTVPLNGTVEINDPPFEDVGSNVTLIEVTPVSDIMPVGTTRQFVATAILADGTSTDVTSSATWASSDETILQVSNETGSQGNASALAGGVASLSATLGEVTGREQVTVSAAVLQSVEVGPAAVVIPVGKTQAYSAVGLFSDGTTEDLTNQVRWTSSTSAVGTVDTSGLATALAAGATTITATDSKSGLSGESTLTVTGSVLTKIQVFPSLPTAASGRTVQFRATGVYSDGQEEDLTSLVTWVSGNTSVATISNAPSSDGLATTLSEGQTNISASFSGIQGQTPLTVKNAELESLEISPMDPVVALGGKVQFKVVGIFTNHTTLDLTTSVGFTSSDKTVAKVSNDAGTRGEATALAEGQSTITATDPKSGLRVATTLQVSASRLQSIAVTPVDISLAKGLSQQYLAMGTYSDGSTRNITSLVTWNSSAPLTAPISNQLLFKGIASGGKPGVTTIKAIDPGSGVFGTTTLTVTDAVLQQIGIAPRDSSTPAGGFVPFTATAFFTDATTKDITDSVNWESSDETIAVIENRPGPDSGEAQGLKVGQTTISATDSPTGIRATTGLTVTAAVLQSIEIRPANPVLFPLEPEQFRARGIYSDGSTVNLTRKVVWRSSKLLVFVISNFLPGQGLGLLPGDATVSATLPGPDLKGETTVTISL